MMIMQKINKKRVSTVQFQLAVSRVELSSFTVDLFGTAHNPTDENPFLISNLLDDLDYLSSHELTHSRPLSDSTQLVNFIKLSLLSETARR